MPQRHRLDYVDALRGFACLWVVFHHAFEGEKALPLGLRQLADIGWLGVSLFLVLSGFCLYFPLVRRQPMTKIKIVWGDYFRRRARRILPPYYLSLLVALGLLGRGALREGQFLSSFLGSLSPDLPLHVLMLHNLTAKTFASISSVAWSLALEWQLYLVFPLLIALAARRGLRVMLGLTLAVSVVWQGVAALRLGVSQEWFPELAVVYHALPGRCFEFACGMFAAALVARPSRDQQKAALWVGGICLLPALILVLFFYRLGPFCDPLWGVVFACVLIALSATRCTSFLARFLVFLGERSYSIYLVHLLIMLAFPVPHLLSDQPLLLGLTRIIVALLAGLVFYRFAEKPFLRTV